MCVKFKQNETDYINWFRSHKNGRAFILNCTENGTYLKLHRSNCWTVTKHDNMDQIKNHHYTSGEPYIKVGCDSKQGMADYIEANLKTGVSLRNILCATCNPVV
jgi:hypothetical protein